MRGFIEHAHRGQPEEADNRELSRHPDSCAFLTDRDLHRTRQTIEPGNISPGFYTEPKSDFPGNPGIPGRVACLKEEESEYSMANHLTCLPPCL